MVMAPASSVKIGFGFTFKVDGNLVFMEASITSELTLNVKIHFFSVLLYSHVDVDVSIENTSLVNGKIGLYVDDGNPFLDKIKAEIPLGKAIPAVSVFPGISVKLDISVPLEWEVSATGNFTSTISKSSGFTLQGHYVTAIPLSHNFNTFSSRDATTEINVSGGIEVSFGPKIEFSIRVLSGLGEVGLGLHAGVRMIAELTVPLHGSGDYRHACSACLSGEVDLFIKPYVFYKLCWGVFSGEYVVAEVSVPLFKFYASMINDPASKYRGIGTGFRIGECENRTYRTVFNPCTSQGDTVESAVVSANRTSEGGNAFQVSGAGQYTAYLYPGRYLASASAIGYNFTNNEFDVLDTAQVIIIQSAAPQNQAVLTIVNPGPKTFGDAGFALSTTGGSGTGAVSYVVTSGADVISISSNIVTILKAGSAAVTATKAGDGSYHLTTSASLTIVVNKGEQNSLSIVDPGAKTYGGANFQLSTTGGSGTGVVSYTVTNGIDIISITGNTATIHKVGTATLVATKLGDSNYETIASSPITITVGKRDLTNVSVSVSESFIYNGSERTPRPSVVDGGLINEADYIVDYVDNRNAGTATVTILATPGGNYTGAPQACNFEINKATLTVRANDVNITATGTPTFTYGMYGFFGGDSETTAVGGGSPIMTSPYVQSVSGVGDYPIFIDISMLVANNYTFVPAPGTLYVGLADQPQLVVDNPGSKAYGDPNFNLFTTGGAGTGSVYYVVTSGTDIIGITGDTVTILKAGIATIIATKAGDSSYGSITSVPITITVDKGEQSSLFITDPGKITYGDPDFALSTIGGGGTGSVSYVIISGADIIGISGNLVKIYNTGTVVITATKAGDDNYYAITSETMSLSIERRSISDALIIVNGIYSYNGNAHTPTLEITAGGRALVLGADYAISANENTTDAGIRSVVVAGINNYIGSKDVIFTITQVGWISLSQTSAYTFPGASYGYGAQTARTITVYNINPVSRPSGALNITLSGTNASSFMLSRTTTWNIASNYSDTFTVAPRTGLGIGTHNATVTVSNVNMTARSFNVSFTVGTMAGADVGVATVDWATANSITVNVVAPPGNGQTVEYAISTSMYGSSLAWQSGRTFNGLNSGIIYYIYTRSALNAYYRAGNFNRTEGVKIITTSSQLVAIGSPQPISSVYNILGNDITVTTPITGFSRGTLDGNRKNIYFIIEVDSTSCENVGLFAYLTSADITIKNLNMNVSIKEINRNTTPITDSMPYGTGDNGGDNNTSMRAGGLIGWVTNGSKVTIDNCHVYGEVTAFKQHPYGYLYTISGGFIGYIGTNSHIESMVTIKNSIANCYVEAITRTGAMGYYFKSYAYAGGFVGLHVDGSLIIQNSHTYGNVAARASSWSFFESSLNYQGPLESYADGLIGYSEIGVSITNSNSYGIVRRYDSFNTPLGASDMSRSLNLLDDYIVGVESGEGGAAVILPGGEPSGVFYAGDIATIVAIPADGYTFAGWLDGEGNIVSKEYKHIFYVIDDKAFYAVFELDETNYQETDMKKDFNVDRKEPAPIKTFNSDDEFQEQGNYENDGDAVNGHDILDNGEPDVGYLDEYNSVYDENEADVYNSDDENNWHSIFLQNSEIL
ncbi:MAG: hypothetical protein FWH01_04180 [Oscillospiraceae bacterium]|nr:hypothetical protein [Oscillospiraceae bacterium]